MTLKQKIILRLYNGLDDWAKWEVYAELKCPHIDQIFAEQAKQSNEIIRKFGNIKGKRV